jgi:hypothetical protein
MQTERVEKENKKAMDDLKKHDGAMLISHEFLQELNIAIFLDRMLEKERRIGA